MLGSDPAIFLLWNESSNHCSAVLTMKKQKHHTRKKRPVYIVFTLFCTLNKNIKTCSYNNGMLKPIFCRLDTLLQWNICKQANKQIQVDTEHDKAGSCTCVHHQQMVMSERLKKGILALSTVIREGCKQLPLIYPSRNITSLFQLSAKC